MRHLLVIIVLLLMPLFICHASQLPRETKDDVSMNRSDASYQKMIILNCGIADYDGAVYSTYNLIYGFSHKRIALVGLGIGVDNGGEDALLNLFLHFRGMANSGAIYPTLLLNCGYCIPGIDDINEGLGSKGGGFFLTLGTGLNMRFSKNVHGVFDVGFKKQSFPHIRGRLNVTTITAGIMFF